MTGREEHQIQTEEKLQQYISIYPAYMNEFYYSLASRSYITKRNYIYAVTSYLKFCSENKYDINNPNESFTIAHTMRYLDTLRYTRQGGEIRSTSKARINLAWSSLNKFFKFMVGSGYLVKNPCDHIDRAKGKDNVQHVYMSANDIKKLYRKLDAHVEENGSWKAYRDRAMITLLLRTGMRCTALTELNLQDICMIKNGSGAISSAVIHITDKEEKSYDRLIAGRALQILTEWLNKRKSLGLSHDAVFVGTDMERISPKVVEAAVRRWCPVINGKQITPHKLRATYGTQLYKATHDIHYVQEMMNHASPNTTQIYIVDEDKSGMNQKANDIMEGLCS